LHQIGEAEAQDGASLHRVGIVTLHVAEATRLVAQAAVELAHNTETIEGIEKADPAVEHLAYLPAASWQSMRPLDADVGELERRLCACADRTEREHE
jgi:hypothetical protein